MADNGTKMNDWPFLILRIFGCGEDNSAFLQELFAAQQRHPGLVDELWFGGSSLEGLEVTEAKVRKNLPYRQRCQDLGIRFSYQQGVTLNHRADGRDHASFTEEAWVVDEDGVRYKGILCPRSPEAYEYNLQTAKKVMSLMRPDSYWPDDDARLLKMDRLFCCCDRCLAAFNKAFHHHYSREEWKACLKNPDPAVAGQARREWIAFNRESNAAFLRVFREAAKATLPQCRLGLQTVSADLVYDGQDFRLALEALSDNGRHPVGIRPGAGYYQDDTPREMLRKSLTILKESSRCRPYGFVRQVCAEVENWPHVNAVKNPDGQMAESALYLASGADSLALYWGSDQNGENPELWAYYFDRLAAWKPFLQRVRDTSRKTSPCGVAMFLGQGRLGLDSWVTEANEAEPRLMVNGVPVTRRHANPQVYALNESLAAAVTPEDLPILWSKPVVMDVAAFRILAKRFPQERVFRQVRLEAVQATSGVTATGNPREIFPGGQSALGLQAAILPACPEGIPLSRISTREDAWGSCLMPTEQGNSLLLIQELDSRNLWTSYRRTMILDVLDQLLPQGGLPVRLLTGGFSLCLQGRVTEKGTTACAYLQNCGIGRTMPLKLAIRHGEFQEYWMVRPEEEPRRLLPIQKTPQEIIYALPPLMAWQGALITGPMA